MFEESTMTGSNRDDIPHNCPRCKAVIPPGETTCYSCGLRLAGKQLESTHQPARSYHSIRKGKVRLRKQNQTALMYFISVFLVIILFAFLFMRASGIPFSTLLPHLAGTTSTVPYPLPKESPLFSDNFLSDGAGWNLQSSSGNYNVTAGHGALTLEIEQHKLLWELLPGERSYSNLILTLNAILSQGDRNNGYGVYIRGTANQVSDLATYYRFEVYGDGSYAIFKGTLNPSGHSISTTIGNYTLSPAIQPQGKLNRLMVIARGSSMSFIVNGQLLKTISDRSYANGEVALFVSNLPQAKLGAQVQFSQLAIYPVQG